MSNIIIKKKDGLIIIDEATKENICSLGNCSHLCVDCANGCPNKCVKVEDYEKKTIDKYDFVTDGYQIVDDDGQVEKFIITRCENFIKDIQYKPTKEQLDNYRKLRDKMKTAYFEADSIDEANIIQYQMVQRKQLFDVRGSMLSDKEAMQLTKRR
jgi:hypothetical protein